MTVVDELIAALGSAVVTDASGNPVELKNLRPDGTIGEPEAEVAEVESDANGDVEAAAEEKPDSEA